MPDWFVSSCPGFPGESVCPAVQVMLTVFCAIGKKQGRIWKSLRLDGVVKVFSICRSEMHKEPAFNNYFIKTFFPPSCQLVTAVCAQPQSLYVPVSPSGPQSCIFVY